MRAWMLLAFCALVGNNTPARAADTFDINVILPLTGGGAFLGKAEQQALQRYEKAANANGGIHGKPLNFVFNDDQTSPQIAVQLANRVKATKPAVILGSALVALCNAMTPLMKDGPVLYFYRPGSIPQMDLTRSALASPRQTCTQPYFGTLAARTRNVSPSSRQPMYRPRCE